MKIIVTGATGFVGQNVIQSLLSHNHIVLAVGRDEKKARSFSWFQQVNFLCCDIHNIGEEVLTQMSEYDAILHLAWSGLPNYTESFHFENNLFADYIFLKKLIQLGLTHILITGTCFEYGMQNGCLDEDMVTYPHNSYALAKDTLRKFMQELQKHTSFTLQWVRLFYMYGNGQSSNSLLSQLERAISNGNVSFNMSEGAQLRDYLSVEEVSRRLVLLLENSVYDGVINICDGEPTSVRQLVEQYLEKRGAEIRLNLGFYPYPDFEPKAFWGSSKYFNSNGKLI